MLGHCRIAIRVPPQGLNPQAVTEATDRRGTCPTRLRGTLKVKNPVDTGAVPPISYPYKTAGSPIIGQDVRVSAKHIPSISINGTDEGYEKIAKHSCYYQHKNCWQLIAT